MNTWAAPASKRGTNVGAFVYAYPNGDLTDKWRVRELQLTQAANEHEIAEFDVLSVQNYDVQRWDSYTPIRIDYGDSVANSGVFLGYLWDNDPEINQLVREPPELRVTRFRAIGASFVMKEGFSGTFVSARTSDIAKSIAETFKFSAFIPPTTYIWPQISSHGASYWAFLVDMATRSGEVVFPTGTMLNVVSPLDVSRQLGQYPAFYSKDAIFPNKNIRNIASLMNFRANDSQYSEEDGRQKANWQVQSLDLTTGQAVAAQSSDAELIYGRIVPGGRYTAPIFDRWATLPEMAAPAVVANNQADATRLALTRSIWSRYPIRAEAEVVGGMGIVPMQLVSFHGLGARHSGRWMVRRLTQHVVWNAHCSTRLSVVRDADFDPKPGGVDPRTIKRGSVIPSRLVGSVWQAKYGIPSVTLPNGGTGGSTSIPPGPTLPGGGSYASYDAQQLMAAALKANPTTAAWPAAKQTALAIAMATVAGPQSSGNAAALYNTIYSDIPNYSSPITGASPEYSVGIWQYNIVGNNPSWGEAQVVSFGQKMLANPVNQAAEALVQWLGSGFQPWLEVDGSLSGYSFSPSQADAYFNAGDYSVFGA